MISAVDDDGASRRSFEVLLLKQLEKLSTRLERVEMTQVHTANHLMQTVAGVADLKQANEKQTSAQVRSFTGSAYEQLMKSTSMSTQNTNPMDEIVRHLEASQARHELASSKPEGRRGRRRTVDGMLTSCCALLPAVPRITRTALPYFRWRIFHLAILAICVIVTPARLAFPHWFVDAESAWRVVELLIDLVFCMDTLFSCVTSYLIVSKPFAFNIILTYVQLVPSSHNAHHCYLIMLSPPGTSSRVALSSRPILCASSSAVTAPAARTHHRA